MKFSSALTILAASGAASATILERQVQAIIGVVNGINTEVGSLDTAIKGFSGDPKPLLAASEKALATVTKGVETVNAASSITLTDSVQIQGQVSNLQASLESVVSGLLGKKADLVAAGQGQAVYKNLQDQLTGAKGLAAAISSKVPPEVKSLADTLSAGIITALQKGIDGFKDAPAGGASSKTPSSAPPAGGASASSSSSAPPPPAGGASSSSSSSTPPSGGASADTPASAPSTPSTAGGSSSGQSGTSASSGSSSSHGSSGSADHGSSGTPSSEHGSAAGTGTNPAVSTGTAAPMAAQFTGAAPRVVAGSFAAFVASVVAFAL
ncbi:hypothetical protein EG328_010342 [Venturia inaequalis]|uniref:Cell wall protein n=1 Tax=Venturia inaequalis TaxID=5025 RepID=A0A8H3U784_VENIN|nr:hypothetical protein EG328_010342 [Venturia inaequalis]